MNVKTSNQVADLIKGFYHPDKQYRASCCQTIVQFGSDAIPFLLPLLNDDDWRVRYRAAETLGLLNAEKAVNNLLSACDDKKDHVRYMAAKALGSIKSQQAVPMLIHLLTDEHPYTRGIAATGLLAIGDPQGVAGVSSAIQQESDPVIKEKMKQSLNALNL